MKRFISVWSAANAKASLPTIIEQSRDRPQIIERHGKPAAAVIGWDMYSLHRTELEGSMTAWLEDLAEINEREGEMEPVPRSDRPLPEGLDA